MQMYSTTCPDQSRLIPCSKEYHVERPRTRVTLQITHSRMTGVFYLHHTRECWSHKWTEYEVFEWPQARIHSHSQVSKTPDLTRQECSTGAFSTNLRDMVSEYERGFAVGLAHPSTLPYHLRISVEKTLEFRTVDWKNNLTALQGWARATGILLSHRRWLQVGLVRRCILSLLVEIWKNQSIRHYSIGNSALPLTMVDETHLKPPFVRSTFLAYV